VAVAVVLKAPLLELQVQVDQVVVVVVTVDLRVQELLVKVIMVVQQQVQATAAAAAAEVLAKAEAPASEVLEFNTVNLPLLGELPQGGLVEAAAGQATSEMVEALAVEQAAQVVAEQEHRLPAAAQP
jgi:hypothetical protein